jgi:hypothetical protein
MAKVDLELLKELTKKYPNDFEFGREMRKFINRVNISKKRTIDGKQSKRDGQPS